MVALGFAVVAFFYTSAGRKCMVGRKASGTKSPTLLPAVAYSARGTNVVGRVVMPTFVIRG